MIKLHPLTYQADCTTIFSSFAKLPNAILLDSGHPSQVGRYDIISALPYCTLTTIADKTLIQTNGLTHETTENPFLVLKALIKDNMMLENDYPALPFIGGALGYWSYDLGRFVEIIPVRAKQDISLPDMVIGIYAWAIITDHVAQSTILMINRKLAKKQTNWESVEKEIFTILKRVNENSTVKTSTSFQLIKPFIPQITKTEYAAKFLQITQHLQAGDCYQVNLTQRFTAEVNGSAWAAYQCIREKVPTPYSAFINLGHSAILSHSPEQFLQIQNSIVTTKPIKGTRPRHVDINQDNKLAIELQQSTKDNAENTMIVDLLRNDLGKVCDIGSVKVTKFCAVESFINVHHLVSTITGQLSDNKTAIDLLMACFPGGSITGAPKLRAMEIIEALEPSRRSVYCGAIGYIDVRGNMNTNIAIRTLVWDKNQLHCSAGGGITIGSKCEAEYQESLDKVEALLKALQ